MQYNLNLESISVKPTRRNLLLENLTQNLRSFLIHNTKNTKTYNLVLYSMLVIP